MRWSIRTKILVILSSLLLIVVSAYLVLAEKIFREDKELLIFDTNRSTTEQLANELDGYLRRIVDKMELLSELVLNRSSISSEKNLGEAIFEKDSDLLAFQLILPSRHQPILGELISKNKIKQLNLNEAQLRSPSILPSSFDPTPSGVVVENKSTEKAVLYLIRVPVQIAGLKKNISLFAQAIVDGRAWEDSFRDSQSLATNFAVTGSGEVFTHPDSSWVLGRKSLIDLEIVKRARSQSLLLQQLEFADGKTHYLGVYRKTSLGSLTVFSLMDKSTARIASRLLLEKTVVLSLIIVTGVLLISLFFSGTLSTPLLNLVEATRQIAQGNFDTPIPVRTQDEIGALAGAFAQMVKDLKSSRLLLEQYNRELEDRISERTQELETKNAAIRSQQDALLKSTRLAAVGEIAGQAAHEVLNPLTGIISSLENLSRQIQTMTKSNSAPLLALRTIVKAWDEVYSSGGMAAWLKDLSKPSLLHPGKTLAHEDFENLMKISTQMERFFFQLEDGLRIVLNESLRIGRIIDKMRGMNRIQRITSSIQISALIEDCVQATRDLFNYSGIKVEVRIQKPDLYVNADGDELWQVFSNLFKNSIDAIHERIRLEEKSGLEPKPGIIRITSTASDDQVIIRVWDNGAGIRKENQDRIFEAYFSTKGAEGTGYGLGLCRRFLRACGGDIVLRESLLSEFTEFELKIPQGNPKGDNLNA